MCLLHEIAEMTIFPSSENYVTGRYIPLVQYHFKLDSPPGAPWEMVGEQECNRNETGSLLFIDFHQAVHSECLCELSAPSRPCIRWEA